MIRASIRKDGGPPRYQQVISMLKEKILAGEYPVGSKLPPERELQEALGLSRMTINRAILELADQGLVKREVGKGTFVIRNSVPANHVRSLGVITPSHRSLLEQPFYWEVMEGIDGQVRVGDFRAVIAGKEEVLLQQPDLAAYFHEMGLAGVILMGQMRPELLARLRDCPLPIVCLNFSGTEFGLDSVVIDGERGGYLAARHLLKLGHRRIGVILGPKENANSQNIQRGFFSCLAKNRVAIEPDHILRGDYMMQDGFRCMMALLDERPRPTAVFCASDMMAMGALNAARALSVEVPGQLSLVGFDDCRLVAHAYPPLTTVRVDMQRLGATAVEMVARRLDGDVGPCQTQVIATELVERASCAPPRED
ncbi:GntR family transcriptional regulator [bacterium]|nr:GntR family transcriptional regulator [bacterium]